MCQRRRECLTTGTVQWLLAGMTLPGSTSRVPPISSISTATQTPPSTMRTMATKLEVGAVQVTALCSSAAHLGSAVRQRVLAAYLQFILDHWECLPAVRRTHDCCTLGSSHPASKRLP